MSIVTTPANREHPKPPQHNDMPMVVGSLLSVRQMQLIIDKERMRSDRFGNHFGLIGIRLLCNRGELKKRLKRFSALLDKRLRLTDEKGMLRDGRVGILLPMTNEQGVLAVLHSITAIASREGIIFRAKIACYPDHFFSADDPFGPEDDGNSQGQAESQLSRSMRSDEAALKPELGAFVADIPVSFESVAIGHSREFISRQYPRWKRSFDISAASFGLLLSSPILLASVLAIRATSKGPAFFLQSRTGHHGKTFRIIKLRTMVQNADELKAALRVRNERDGPAFKIKDDPRVTRIGNLLRRTGLDELPQLINVLRGEMAIVGPRPLPCDEDADCLHWQRRRLDTKPGLTCNWQIAKSRKIAFVDWMRMDLRYADSRSVGGDIALVFKTIGSVFLGRVGH